MKRIFTEESQKKRFKKSSERELAKRSEKSEVSGYQGAREGSRRQERKRPKVISLPLVFSVAENTTETLKLFSEFQSLIEVGRKIFVDMSRISRLSLDALLYMLRIFDYYRIKKNRFNISGNVPSDRTCLKLLVESGFFSYVKSNIQNRRPIGDVLEVKSGTDIEPTVAGEVIDFSLRHLKQSPSDRSKAVYRTIIELMANTKEHAYSLSNDSKIAKWYLIAWNDEYNKNIKFAFLDGGLGIPFTIKKSFSEKASEILSFIVERGDAKLIRSALEGEFRTRTELGHRGKGLPDIYDKSKIGLIDDLKVISSYGAVFCSNKQEELNLDRKFYGSLYVWNFV